MAKALTKAQIFLIRRGYLQWRDPILIAENAECGIRPVKERIAKWRKQEGIYCEPLPDLKLPMQHITRDHDLSYLDFTS